MDSQLWPCKLWCFKPKYDLDNKARAIRDITSISHSYKVRRTEVVVTIQKVYIAEL